MFPEPTYGTITEYFPEFENWNNSFMLYKPEPVNSNEDDNDVDDDEIAFTGSLFWAKYHFQDFLCNVSFNPHKNPMTWSY